MSGPFDERFTERHIVSGTLLEFGCSPGAFTSRLARARPDVRVTGIDLYQASCTEGYRFIHSDLMECQLDDVFDNVCCVSSWEHCGIETANFADGYAPHLDYHLTVAERLMDLVAPGGRLIVTCPFGPDEVWLTYSGRPDALFGAVPRSEAAPRWGYRASTVVSLEAAFHRLQAEECEAMQHVGGDYFDIANWCSIDPHVLPKETRRAVVGMVLRRAQ